MALQCTIFMASGLITAILGYPCQHIEPMFTSVAPLQLSREATHSKCGASTEVASQAMGLSQNLEGAPSENALAALETAQAAIATEIADEAQSEQSFFL